MSATMSSGLSTEFRKGEWGWGSRVHEGGNNFEMSSDGASRVKFSYITCSKSATTGVRLYEVLRVCVIGV